MDTARRSEAAEAYVQAMRTGEATPAKRLRQFVADDVAVVLTNGQTLTKDDAVGHVTGDWPFTPIFIRGGWSLPKEEGENLVVEGQFPLLGAAPRSVKLTFSFDDDDRISRVVEELTMAGPPQPATVLSLPVRGAINSALANGTPMVLAYTDDNGEPSLSLRGSVQVFGDTQLCLWLRSATGGLADAIQTRPGISLLYRDSRTRTTLIIKGRAHIESDAATRERVFNLAPEVEQQHDPNRTGAALLIDVTQLRGTTPDGPVLVEP